jgi:hypothetical protein
MPHRRSVHAAFALLCLSAHGEPVPASRSALRKPSLAAASPFVGADVRPLGKDLVAFKQEVSTAKEKGKKGGAKGNALTPKQPSYLWALLANWLSYLSLGLTIPVLARVISTIVNPDGSDAVSPRSSVVGGDVEALDKILTFLFCGTLGALSDVVGRKPLMAYSALGFALTCFLQAQAGGKSLSLLFVADFVDGMSSCMNNVCQAYVADTSAPELRAKNLGVFMGVSVAGAFIIGFPLSAVIAEKCVQRNALQRNARLSIPLPPRHMPALVRTLATPSQCSCSSRALLPCPPPVPSSRALLQTASAARCTPPRPLGCSTS